jgi:excisionase family DNA binding protein
MTKISGESVESEFMTDDEVAALLGFQRDFVCRSIRAEQLPNNKIGGRYRSHHSIEE